MQKFPYMEVGDAGYGYKIVQHDDTKKEAILTPQGKLLTDAVYDDIIGFYHHFGYDKNPTAIGFIGDRVYDIEMNGKPTLLKMSKKELLNMKQTYEAKQTTRGAYYVEVELNSGEYEENTMLYDIWSNIKYKGKTFPDVELSFVVKNSNGYYSFGLPSANYTESTQKFSPYISGIDHQEKIRRGDIRKVIVDCKVPYTSNKMYAVDNIEYRLYTKDGVRELDVIDYSKVERGYNTNYFLIDTNDLIPSRYYIDLKIKYDMEEVFHRDMIEFEIVNDVTEVYN
jgi:hypothetical protein